MNKIGFFETLNNGQIEKSSMRLQTFIASIVAVIIALISVFMVSVTLGDALPMVITLLAYSFGAKVFQKAIENKKTPPK